MPFSRRSLIAAAAGLAASPLALRAQGGGEVLVARLRPAVVGLVVKPAQAAAEPASAAWLAPAVRRNPRDEVVASGTLIAPDGLVLTVASVFESPGAVQVRTEAGTSHEGRLVALDRRSDLALVRIEGRGLPHVRLAAPVGLAVGERVWALGRPAIGADAGLVATDGVVSALGLGSADVLPYIQSNAALYPGMGGGPLVREKTGEVIGLNALQYLPRAGPSFLFAVPIESYLAVAADLLRDGRVRRGSLGLTLAPLTQESATAIGLVPRRGVLVTAMGPGSGAEVAGMLAGDVVLAIGTTPVESPVDVARLIGQSKPGDRLQVSVYRRGRTMVLDAVAGESGGSGR